MDIDRCPEGRSSVMRRLLLHLVGLGLIPCGGLAPAYASEPILKDKAEATCGSHGTRIDFVDTPTQAAKIAKKEEKLVFVLHVSGNFEDPRFT
jgi:hypothetical protein